MPFGDVCLHLTTDGITVDDVGDLAGLVKENV